MEFGDQIHKIKQRTATSRFTCIMPFYTSPFILLLSLQAQILMSNLKEHVDVWRERRERAKSHLQSALGDSTLVSACTVYFGVLTNEQREIAVQEWKRACYNVSHSLYINCDTSNLSLSETFFFMRFIDVKRMGLSEIFANPFMMSIQRD